MKRSIKIEKQSIPVELRELMESKHLYNSHPGQLTGVDIAFPPKNSTAGLYGIDSLVFHHPFTTKCL